MRVLAESQAGTHRAWQNPLAGLSIAILATMGSVSSAHANPDVQQIIVDLQDDTGDAEEAAIEALMGGIDIRLNSIHSADERMFIADVPSDQVAAILQRLKTDPRVEIAEPNAIYHLIDPPPVSAIEGPDGGDAVNADNPSLAPNDPLWSRQWSFRMVNVADAWSQSLGAGVVVAVIDTGVAYEDYKGFRKVEDLAGTEFVPGYDFTRDTDHPNDDHGHGTHVAGTIAQTTNNGIGVAGVAPRAKIMPLKVLTRRGSGTAADIADAIRFAADNRANVINMSLGGGIRSFAMQSAVRYARSKGVVVVCAAGNGGRRKVEFPAAYPGAFAVSSVGPTRKLAYYSSYGKQVAISAPGGDKQVGGDQGGVLQNTIVPERVDATNLYLAFQGTSMATPHVAGAAALIIATGVTDPDDVEDILKKSAQDAGPAGWDEQYGAGILDAAAAVRVAEARTTGGVHLIAALMALAAFAWRWRRRIALLPLVGPGALGALIGASGLFFIDGLGFLSLAMPRWDLAVFGPSGHFNAAWASVLPMLLLVVLSLGVRRLRGFLLGLVLGWAAHLFLSGLLMPTDVLGIPGLASGLDRAWLLVQAGLLLGLAALIARVMARAR